MSLNVSKVWLKSEEQEVLVDSRKIKEGDNIVVHMGNVIPLTGWYARRRMVNQSSLTGEPLPVLKRQEDMYMPEAFWKRGTYFYCKKSRGFFSV